MIRRALRSFPGFSRLNRYLRRRYAPPEGRLPETYARGHFYSPLPDVEWVAHRKERLYRRDIDLSGSLDLRKESQRSLLTSLIPLVHGFPYFEGSDEELRFSLDQSYFCEGDALILYAMMQRFGPRRVIEVGSGHSSALMLDTAARTMEHEVAFTFVEPFPDRLFSIMTDQDRASARVIPRIVQDVPLEEFDRLEKDDILFIDSSHVSKAGSDVNYLVFEVLPILRPGVLVHFHDIFWPLEYPLEWIRNGRAWNEIYLLRAFLQYNDRFEILLFNNYIAHAFRDLLMERMSAFMRNPGGSLWLRKRENGKVSGLDEADEPTIADDDVVEHRDP